MEPRKITRRSRPTDGPPAVLAKVGAINALLSFKSRHNLETQVGISHWLSKASNLLDLLYRQQRDIRSQQHLELQLIRARFRGATRTSLTSIAHIAREEANYRLESECLHNVVGESERDFRLWSTANALILGTSDVHYVHLIVDAVELVAFVTRFRGEYSMLKERQSMSVSLGSSHEQDGRFNLLHMVVAAGNCAALRILLERGEDLQETNRAGETVLQEAAIKGNEAMARLILEHDKTLSFKHNESGLLPMHIAADKGHDALVQLFAKAEKKLVHERVREPFAKKAVPDEDEIYGQSTHSEDSTALHLAAANGHEAVVISLLQYQAYLEARDVNGRTALHRASARWQYDVVYLLLRHGAHVNSKTQKGQTALQFAVEDGQGAQVELLLEHGANTLVADEDGTTPLHFAAKNRHLDVVKMLLEYRADINAKDKNGRTALHYAAENGDEGLAELLLDSGSNVLSKSKDGLWTALHIAANNGHMGVVKLVLGHPEGAAALIWRAGIGPDAKTARELAARNGHVEIEKLLGEARLSEPAF